MANKLCLSGMCLSALRWKYASSWFVIFVTVLFAYPSDTAGQPLRIVTIQRDEGKVSIIHPAEPDFYYVLRRGQSVTQIRTAVSLELGERRDGALQTGELIDDAPPPGTAFYQIVRVALETPLDSDSDGIDDVYELRHPEFLHPLNSADAQRDPGGDGKTHLDEYLIATKPLATIEETSPANSESGVAVTRETIFRFTDPLHPESILTTNHIFAVHGGRRLLSRIELSSDRKTASLFYLEPLPASSSIQVTLDGTGLLDFLNRPIDADADGNPGGSAAIQFDTLSTTAVQGTAVIGRVFASELESGGGNSQTGVNRPLAGVTITVDGAEETLRTVTDANGNFRLEPAPAGRFFVLVDGRTAKDVPPGAYYPFVGKAWEAAPGRENLAGGTGEIYLPLIPPGTLRPASPIENTTVTFPQEVLQKNPELEGVSITVPANSLYSDNGARGGMIGIAPVPPDRLPEPLPAGLNLPIVITIQTDGPSNFDRPVPVRFPNLPDPVTGERLPPGSKSALWSFNHDTGRWEIQGSMTVSADGTFVESDPGVGVRQPGWHGTRPGTQGDGGPPPLPPPQDNCADIPDCIVQRQGICTGQLHDAIIEILQGICDAFNEELGHNPTMSSANDGGHGEHSRHYNNKAVDFSGLRPGGGRYSGAELRPLAERISGVNGFYNRKKNWWVYNFNRNGHSFRLLLEDPDNRNNNSHFHLQLNDGRAGNRNQPEPCDCPEDATDSTASALALRRQLAQVATQPLNPSPPFHVAIATGTNLVQRMTSDRNGFFRVILPADTRGTITLFEPVTRAYWVSEFFTPAAGQTTLLTDQTKAEWERQAELSPLDTPDQDEEEAAFELGAWPGATEWIVDQSTDVDADGLGMIAEQVLGTNPQKQDTDGDGVPDGAEVQGGTDPLDGLPVRTGIIATADTSGSAVDICIQNERVLVADSEAGVALFNVFNGMNPVLIGQVDTPGIATRVACDGEFAAVADGAAGVALLNLSAPSGVRIAHQVGFGADALAVAVRSDIAVVGLSNGKIVSIDIATGMTIGQAQVNGAVRDVMFSGDYLYAISSGAFFIFELENGELLLRASVASPEQNRRLFVGDTVAYTIHPRGYNTIDIANPLEPKLIASGKTAQFGWKQIASNGSGIGIAAVGANSSSDGLHHVSMYDLRDPEQTDQFITTFETPGTAHAVAIHHALAYVADGESGIQVVNYLPYDSLGVQPAVTLSSSLVDNSSVEGQPVRITAHVADDVQVRQVEFFLNGTRIASDGSFPFEHRFLAPMITGANTTVTLTARATDTGGNSRLSTELLVRLVPDTFPPEVRAIVPRDEAVFAPGILDLLTAKFSEPIAPNTLAGRFSLVAAGPDELLGTGDDTVVPDGRISFRGTVNTAFLEFDSPLAPGRYQLVIRPGITDLAGNIAQQTHERQFQIFLANLIQQSGFLQAGSFDIAGNVNSYGFTGRAGDILRLRMSTDKGLQPTLEVVDAQGNPMGNATTFGLETLLELTLPSDGLFAIIARDRDGDGTGNYGLSVQRLNNPSGAVPVDFGQATQATIAAISEMDPYTVQAQAGDTIRVRMTATAGIQPAIELFDSAGKRLGDATTFGSEAVLDVPLQSSGTFLILLADRYGDQIGNYGFSVQRLNSPSGVAPVEFAQTTQATIAAVTEMDPYTFQAQAGDTIRVRMTATAGIQPAIELFDSAGKRLGDATTFGSEAVLDVPLQSSGTFLILLADRYGDQTGDYGFSLQRLNNPTGAVPVEFGPATQATVASVTEMDPYTFQAQAGDIIRVRMSAAAGIQPAIELLDSAGERLGDATTFGREAVLDVPLQSSGTFLILLADRYGDQTGDYGFSLQRLNNPSGAVPVQFGQPTQATIAAVTEMDPYTFQAQAGDTIRVRMSAIAGIYPAIEMFDPAGKRLGDATTFGREAVLDVTVQSAGTFLILLADRYGDQTGDYTLIVDRAP